MKNVIETSEAGANNSDLETIDATGMNMEEITKTALSGVAGDNTASPSGTAPEKTEQVDSKPVENVDDSGINKTSESDSKSNEGNESDGPTDTEDSLISDIMSEKGKTDDSDTDTDIHVTKEDGVSEKAQAKINGKINAAIKERNIAKDELTIAREEARIAKEEVSQLRASQAAGNRPEVPLQSNFETEEDYQKAVVKWKDDDDNWKKVIEKSKNNESVIKERLTKHVERYNANVSRMKDRYPDYESLVETKGTAVDYGNLDILIVASDFAPEISYFLAKTPTKLDEIKNMSRADQALAIGELSGQFRSVKPKTTNAPKPIIPLKGSEGGPTDSFSTEVINKISREILRTA